MNNLKSLDSLYSRELRDLYSAEFHQVEALAKMAEAANSMDLKVVFAEHLDGTVDHLNRLEAIFKVRGESPRGKHCAAMEALLQECRDWIHENAGCEVLDAGLIAIAQKAEHYEIAAYGTVRTFASLLGDEKTAETLRETLCEEREVDQKLSELAIQFINQEACPPASAAASR